MIHWHIVSEFQNVANFSAHYSWPLKQHLPFIITDFYGM